MGGGDARRGYGHHRQRCIPFPSPAGGVPSAESSAATGSVSPSSCYSVSSYPSWENEVEDSFCTTDGEVDGEESGDSTDGVEHDGVSGGGGEEGRSSVTSVDGIQSGRWVSNREVEVARRRHQRTYNELRQSYCDGGVGRRALFVEAKDAILRYTPAKWTESAGGAGCRRYDVPSTTTLLLVGPRGSGKSSLVNMISRFLEDNPLLPDRAQVFHNSSIEKETRSMQRNKIPEGTNFLQEYMIPRDSTSFCVFDTHGLSEIAYENFYILERWMSNGVRNGDMVLRYKNFNLLSRLKAVAQDIQSSAFVRRRVNFIIFVVDGISVLNSIYNKNKDYCNLLVETFNYTFMSFIDNKPAVVVTHGDLLSFHERALVCTHLGKLLGIPATKHIFDIPDSDCLATKSAILDLLRYCLVQADRKIPFAHVSQGTPWMAKLFRVCVRWMLVVEILVIVLLLVSTFLGLELGSSRSLATA